MIIIDIFIRKTGKAWQDKNQFRREHIMTLVLLLLMSVLMPLNQLNAKTINDKIDSTLDQLLNARISSATKYEQNISDAPASVTMITSDDIEKYGWKTLAELISSLRGFYTTNDRNYEYVGIRGFQVPSSYGNKMLLLIDGMPLNEKIYGSTFYGNDLGLDPEVIDKIEIVRGPGSALYGSGAVFSVINIITKDIDMVDKLSLKGEVGNLGHKYASMTTGSEPIEDMKILISGNYADIAGEDNLYFEEYKSDPVTRGIANGLDWEKSGGVVIKGNYKNLLVEAFYSDRIKAIPTAPWETTFGKLTRTGDEKLNIGMRYSTQLSNDIYLLVSAYHNTYNYSGYYYYDTLQYETAKSSWITGELLLNWDIAVDNRFSLGLNYENIYKLENRVWRDNETANRYFKSVPYRIASIFVQDNYQILENLALNIGARYENCSTISTTLNPRGAIIYDPTENSTLKLIYGEAYREPNIYEMFYEEPHLYKNNPGLKPEKFYSSELVYEQKFSEHFFGTISLFYTKMDNLIDQFFDETDSLIQFRNVNKVVSNGFEIEMTAQLPFCIRGSASYSYSFTYDEKTGSRIPNSPMHLVKTAFSRKLIEHLYTSVNTYYEYGRMTYTGNQIGGNFIADLNILYRPDQEEETGWDGLLDNLNLSLRIRNLLDNKYFVPAGAEHLVDKIVQGRRSVILSIGYKVF